MSSCVSAIRFLRNKPLNRAPKVLSAAYSRSGSCLQKLCQTSISTDKDPDMACNMEDCALPNEMWSKESVDLFNELNKLTEEGKGWEKIRLKPSIVSGSDGSRLFLRALEEKGKFLELAIFCNPSLRRVKAVVQFGLYTRGPIGHVHGGAVATMLDTVMANCAVKCGFQSLTANVNVDFKRGIPLNSTVLAEATIDKVEGKKVFTSAALKTVDGNVTYANSTGLFIMTNKAGYL